MRIILKDGEWHVIETILISILVISIIFYFQDFKSISIYAAFFIFFGGWQLKRMYDWKNRRTF